MVALIPMAAKFRLDELLARPPEEGGLSMSELARRSGVSFVTINAIAKNRTRQVHLDTLEKLSTALGVQPGDLIVREADPPRRRKAS
jgi:DNA-binding Xre family transcriptional regulator